MKNFKALFATLLLLFACFIWAPEAEASTTTDKTLAIDWEDIESVGKQLPGSVTCFCHALAYSRTILDGKVHNWWEYDLNGGSHYNACANWRGADYLRTAGSASDIYQKAYESINEGRPFIIHVSGRGTGWHYVTIVGYTNVTDVNDLDASNFLIIDAAPHSAPTGAENMAEVGYSLNYTGQYCYTSSGNAGHQIQIPDSVIERLLASNPDLNKYDQKALLEAYLEYCANTPATISDWIGTIIG